MNLSNDNRPSWLNHSLSQTNPVYVAQQFAAHLEGQYQADQWNGSRTGQDLMAQQVRKLAADGGRMPDCSIEDFIRKGALQSDFQLDRPETRPGVLGLVVDENSSLKLVLPLRPEPTSWRIEPSLPFGANDIQD